MKDINYRVIAFDPGGTTGWATYSAHVDADAYTREEWKCGQLEGQHHEQLEILLGNQRVENYIIVCERFDDRPAGEFAVNLKAKEYIGIIETFAMKAGLPVARQMPAAAKGFTKPVNLKRLGLYYPKDKHAMDAYKHVLWFLIHRERRVDILRKGWPNG